MTRPFTAQGPGGLSPRPLIFIVIVGVLVALPWLGLNAHWVRQIVLISMLALVVSGLSLTLGYAGELNVGQPAIYAAGAYMAGYLAVNHVNDVVVGSLMACLIAMVVGLLAAAPAMRLGGWILAIASFFLVLLVPEIANLIDDPVGGFEGMVGIPRPMLFGMELDSRGFYAFAVIIASLWFAVFANLVKSPRGAAFRVLGSGEALATSLGISTYRLKLQTYVVGAIPAGLAGTLFAYMDGYISPTSFGLHAAVMILAAGILGGVRTIYGAILGATLIQLGPMSSTAFQDYAILAFGLFLLIGGVLLPNGLAPLCAKGIKRALSMIRAVDVSAARASTEDCETRGFPQIAGIRLEVTGISKAFGGNRALDEVTFTAEPGKITALIGPNGSGKTTLLNTVSGYYKPDSGSIGIGGENISTLAAYKRARLGISRTFQTPTMPEELSVGEVVRTGALPREVGVVATMLRLPSYRKRLRDGEAMTTTALRALNLLEFADTEAVSMPLGTRRLIELARAMASESGVFLLDEVASGLDHDEVAHLATFIEGLRDAGATVILVEHNFDLIQAIADHVVVLAEGKVLAAGTAGEIAVQQEVRDTYLGGGPKERTDLPGMVPEREESR